MATYKVLQDIEAEDTLIGPLTLRQCIYAAIAVVAAYLSFVFISKHVAFMALFMLPFIGFGVFFAFPWSKQQSTEVWALAKIRFFLKPRKRIWNQSGVKQLVTITAPKAVKNAYASNLSPVEVKSRLKALADTIDSRGWAVKNVDLGYYSQPSILAAGNSDRLINEANLPQEVPDSNYGGSAAEDIFDLQNSPVAQKFDAMMTQSAGTHRQQIIQQLNQQGSSLGAPQPTVPNTDYWHMPQPAAALPAVPVTADTPSTLPANPLVLPTQNVSTDLQLPSTHPVATPVISTPVNYSGVRTPGVQPAAQAPPAQPLTSTPPAVTAQPNPAILELANNNDLNVATIAREAQARNPEPPDEIVVSLH